MEPPSRTKSRRSIYWPFKAPASTACLVIWLSSSEANFSPQPLNVKSSREGVPVSIMVMAPWSRAHVSLVAHSRKRTLFMLTVAAICFFTSSGSGVTINSNSRFAISLAMFIKHSCTSASMYAQSVPACGHVNCIPLCVYHSAGKWGALISTCTVMFLPKFNCKSFSEPLGLGSPTMIPIRLLSI